MQGVTEVPIQISLIGDCCRSSKFDAQLQTSVACYYGIHSKMCNLNFSLINNTYA